MTTIKGVSRTRTEIEIELSKVDPEECTKFLANKYRCYIYLSPMKTDKLDYQVTACKRKSDNRDVYIVQFSKHKDAKQCALHWLIVEMWKVHGSAVCVRELFLATQPNHQWM